MIKLNRVIISMIIIVVLGTVLTIGCLGSAAPIQQIEAQVTQVISSSESSSSIPFDYTEIDDTAGDIKLVGDIDLDGFPDLIIGGMGDSVNPAEPMTWYEYPDWTPHQIAVANAEFTTDGALGDVDGDDDLDIVVPDGSGTDNLLWFENPLPGGDPTVAAQWTRHVVGSGSSWVKDVELADFDENGRLDIAFRTENKAGIFFQTSANNWSETTLSGVELGNEGMASGDINGDDAVDLVLRGTWVKNPTGAAAQTAVNWVEYTIGTANSDFKALVVDLNQDDQNDVLFSSSENTADVDWWTPTSGDPTGAWTKHTIRPSVERSHTLQAADMDLDGDIDVVLAQMHISSAQEIMIMENLNGDALSWQKEVVATGGIHNGVVADVGNDGDFDIYGANWTGNPPVKLWENQLDKFAGVRNWTYKQVTAAHAQTFGLAFGNVDGDTQQDIISGRYWYRNPGGDMLGNWVQSELPSGMEAALVLDVDGDNSLDIIAQKNESDIALYWLEPTNATGTTWNSTLIGTVDRASHDLGAQGYHTGQIEAGGKEEIAFSSGNGIYYFRIPADPTAGNWPRVHINGNPSDEGFALGDIDKDNDIDVAATTGDSKRVEWYQNPGNGSADWTAVHIGDFSDAVYPDRTGLGDFNGNGRLDIVVTEENGLNTGAETYWWEQPADPLAGNWVRHLVTTQATTNSLDVADLDQNGSPDIVLAEHRGDKRVSLWLNDGSGSFSPYIVDTGKESHLGGRTVDLDQDGDLDIVSIAFDSPNMVHLWRNDAPHIQPPTLTPEAYLPLITQ